MRTLPDKSSDRVPSLALVSRPLIGASAFTLVELLVVIAIVGVLVAIAYPIFARVSLSGKEVKTVNRLRTLQQANMRYANDHNGRYLPYRETGPVTVNGDTRTDAYWWYNPEFITLLGTNNDPYYYTNPPDVACSALIPMSLSQALTTSFGYNVDALTSMPPYWPPATRQLSTLPSMSRLMAFADSQDSQIQSTAATAYVYPEKHTNYAIAYRYNDAANVVFFDGHVEQLKKENVVNNTMLWRGQ